MRWLWLGLLALLAASLGFSQGQKPDLMKTVRPQVLMSLRRDPNGSRADLIEVRTIDPRYPVEQLRAQLIDLGRQLNSEPRGLLVARSSITGIDESMTTIKGSCAIDNVIDREQPRFHLQEVARAFAGYDEPNQVTGISVMYFGEQPTKSTLLSFGKEGDPVQVQGVYDPLIGGVEYRIKLNTQDPAKIEIPEGIEQKADSNPSSVAKAGPDWMNWGLIALAALAVGALVYSLLVRTSSSKRARG